MIEQVIEARPATIGPGFSVARVLPVRGRRMVGPFIFLDHAGPLALPPDTLRTADVLPHPHIGLSTVSYLFDGQITHRDSLGVEQTIRPGEVNWMTAGRGIAHSERFDDPRALAGHPLELIQSWVALPERDEEVEPTFANYGPADLPVVDEHGAWLRVIAGRAYGVASRVATHSPLFYLHAELQPGASLAVPDGYSERAAYVARGAVTIDGVTYPAGVMPVFTAGSTPTVVASSAATIMMLGGEPLGRRHIWWNFVSSRKERIEQAKADWQAGRIALPPNDNQEFIPLPADRRAPAAEPLS